MNRETVGRPIEILLLEDDLLDAREKFRELRSRGIFHRLTWLRNDDDALEYLGQSAKFKHAPTPDLIFLDLGLPGRDRLVEHICQQDALRGVPIVVMTADPSDANSPEMMKLTVEACVAKPLDLTAFGLMTSCLCRSRHEGMILIMAS